MVTGKSERSYLAPNNSHMMLLLNRIDTVYAINSGGHNPPGISGTLTTGIQSGNFWVLQALLIAGYADRRRRARFHTDQNSLIGVITLHFLAKDRQCTAQSLRDRKSVVSGRREEH